MSMIADRRRRSGPRVVRQQLGLGQGQVVGTGFRVDGNAAGLSRRDLRRGFGKTDMSKVRPSARLESHFEDSAYGSHLGGLTAPLEEGFEVIAVLRLEAGPRQIEDRLVLAVHEGDGVERLDSLQQVALIARIEEWQQGRAAVAGEELEASGASGPQLVHSVEFARIYTGIEREVDQCRTLPQLDLVAKDLCIEHLGPRERVIDDGRDPAGGRRSRHVLKIGWA